MIDTLSTEYFDKYDNTPPDGRFAILYEHGQEKLFCDIAFDDCSAANRELSERAGTP